MSETPAEQETIWIVTDDKPQTPIRDGRKGVYLPEDDWGSEVDSEYSTSKDVIPVSTRKLEQKMARFLQSVGRLFNQAEKQSQTQPGMLLDEIELSVEIGADGEIKLIGSGAKANAKGAIKLKFKRQEPKAN